MKPAKKRKKAAAAQAPENENPNTAPAGDATAKAAKPAKEKKTKPKPLIERILCKRDFTPQELADLGQQSARLQNDVEAIKQEAAAIAKDYKSKIEMKQTANAALCTKLSNGYEMAETPAEVVFIPGKRLKRYVNPKKKDEVYKEEAMTEADWQLPMFAPKDVASKKPKTDVPGANNKPAPVLDPAVAEAALALPKLEFDLDGNIGEGKLPAEIVKRFKSIAKGAGWAPKIVKAVAAFALEHEDQGVGDVANTLRAYCVQK